MSLQFGKTTTTSTVLRASSKRYARRKKFLFLFLFFCLACNKEIEIAGQSYPRQELVLTGKDSKTLWSSSQSYIVASDSKAASEVGVQILASGGNIVDSAIAVSFVLAVVRPQSTGLGGGGFLLMHLKGQTQAFDFRERAPLKAHRDLYRLTDKKNTPKEMWESRDSLLGPRSVAVPGTIAGLIQIHKEYGKLNLSQLLKPAVRLAEQGFIVYESLAEAIDSAYADMDENMRLVFAPQNKKLRAGQRLIQKDLAKTLRLLAKEDSAAFYRREGKIAQALLRLMQRSKGLISAKDLESYRVFRVPPLWSEYRGYKLATMPPPSSGIFLLSMLKMLEPFPLQQLYQSQRAKYYQILIEAMRQGYKDRALYGGDSRFFPAPIKKLLSPAALKISPAHKRDTPSANTNKVSESYDTTHFSIMDKQGNALSSTQSINYRFGARVMVPGWGIILNDTMDDFSKAPGKPNAYGLIGGKANAIAGGKTPLSSMSPTLLFDKKGASLAVGAPGGSHIITAVLQAIIHDVDLNMHPLISVARGRIHHQYKPETVFVESQALKKEEQTKLKNLGYTLKSSSSRAKLFVVKRKGSTFVGASDPRGDGAAAGAPSAGTSR